MRGTRRRVSLRSADATSAKIRIAIRTSGRHALTAGTALAAVAPPLAHFVIGARAHSQQFERARARAARRRDAAAVSRESFKIFKYRLLEDPGVVM